MARIVHAAASFASPRRTRPRSARSAAAPSARRRYTLRHPPLDEVHVTKPNTGNKKGPPPWRGKRPGEGVPKQLGVAPEVGLPPEIGVPKGVGREPGQQGQIAPGTVGQVQRGAPGQMDPWAENPWEAPDGVVSTDDWRPPPPPAGSDEEEGDDFYMSHPNFLGANED
jgi:hypothetical protein